MELPRIEPIYQKYRDSGFEVVAIDIYGSDKRAKQFINKNNLSYTTLSGNIDMATDSWQIDFTPVSFVIDRAGRIIRVHSGFNEGDEQKLEEEIARLVLED